MTFTNLTNEFSSLEWKKTLHYYTGFYDGINVIKVDLETDSFTLYYDNFTLDKRTKFFKKNKMIFTTENWLSFSGNIDYIKKIIPDIEKSIKNYYIKKRKRILNGI